MAVGCNVWYSEEGPGRAAAPPSPLLAVPNLIAHPSAASVPITVLLYKGPLLCGFNVPIKGLKRVQCNCRADSLSTRAQRCNFSTQMLSCTVGFVTCDLDKANQSATDAGIYGHITSKLVPQNRVPTSKGPYKICQKSIKRYCFC